MPAMDGTCSPLAPDIPVRARASFISLAVLLSLSPLLPAQKALEESYDSAPSSPPSAFIEMQSASDPTSYPAHGTTLYKTASPPALEVPLGFAGPSSVASPDLVSSADFIPMPDRWRIGFPYWDRSGKGRGPLEDSPYDLGHWYDPYNQNVLKGDYPIVGQHTFLNITLNNFSLLEARELPTPTTPFESTARPFQEQFFGLPRQFVYTSFYRVSIDLFHGDAAFKPRDWFIRIAPVFNFNNFDVAELAFIHPDVRKGTVRNRTHTALEEYFVETKLLDYGPDYDFVSLRVGSQFYSHDPRGFVFTQTNRGIRIFGTRLSNRDQFNIAIFDEVEKETNSELNTFHDRNQNTLSINYYRQDFIWPGLTAHASILADRNGQSFLFSKNNNLVRPDPAGVAGPHEVSTVYFGLGADGHIGRYNVVTQFYWVVGYDDLNPISNRPIHIDAQMFALELSYDRDWMRFRTSFFWASGDDNPNDNKGQGFDAVFDNPNFAGGDFSFWVRQQIPLFGVNLKNRLSLLPDLRATKTQGQPNFVNPGLFLINVGCDTDITPRLKSINNVNLLYFDDTAVLETFLFQGQVKRTIGCDISTGLEYRPLLSNNVVLVIGASALIPQGGFRDLYNNLRRNADPMMAGFCEISLTY
jgi:hypothetical protein